MNNKVGFFLNLDQGSLTNQQVVEMLAEVGYDCIEYGMRDLPVVASPSCRRA